MMDLEIDELVLRLVRAGENRKVVRPLCERFTVLSTDELMCIDIEDGTLGLRVGKDVFCTLRGCHVGNVNQWVCKA